MYVVEKGFVKESRGYLRDTNIELADLLKWTKSRLLIISDQVLKEEQARGFDKTPIVLVDGNKSKKPIDVDPLGKIEFISRQNISDILLTSYRSLLDLSKVLTGAYKASHFVFLNGNQVATDLTSLQSWLQGNPDIKENDLVRIVDIQPYARKLELRGITSKGRNTKLEDKGRRKGVKTGILINKPNGAYQLTSRRIKTKFKNNVAISFNFIPGTSLGISAYFKRSRENSKSVKIHSKTGRFAKEDPNKANERTYLYPSLVFKLTKEGGLSDV